MIHVPVWNPDLRVIELSEEGGVVADAILRLRDEQDEKREKGLHVSTIVNDYVETAYPQKRKPLPSSMMVAYQEVGNLIEDVIAEQLRLRSGWMKPAPKTVGGIIMSPDGYHAPTKTIDEMKATWTSENDFLSSPKFFKYCMQALNYAHGWDAERIRLHVLFINGNYRPPAPKLPRTFTLRWKTDVPALIFQRTQLHARDKGWLP